MSMPEPQAATPNNSLHPTCYGCLRQPSQAGELKRYAESKGMTPGLRISIIDPDEDYLGIEVAAASGRFAGTIRIYAGLNEISIFASRIAGFPTTAEDRRNYEFGSTDPRVAGGFALLRFHCVEGSGHQTLELIIEDDQQLPDIASARFAFQIGAVDLDRFVARLRHIERDRSGEATLPATA
jgi:hypothetical protein